MEDLDDRLEMYKGRVKEAGPSIHTYTYRIRRSKGVRFQIVKGVNLNWFQMCAFQIKVHMKS